MNITKTVKSQINVPASLLQDTLDIYREALSCIMGYVDQSWDSIAQLKDAKSQQRFVECLIHGTRTKPAKFSEFGERFYKFPSYLRRACITEAIGCVSSYRSHVANWEAVRATKQAKGKRFFAKKPTLQCEREAFPVFYKTAMWSPLSATKAKIKIYQNNDWVWLTIGYDARPFKDRDLENYKAGSPTLIIKNSRAFLHIPYESKVTLTKYKANDSVVIGVDLGLTKSAVCCAMHSDGTVIDRVFIDPSIEKDRLNRTINKLRKLQRHGCVNAQKVRRKINFLQTAIADKTVNQILAFAQKHQASHLVFEHLGKMRPPRDSYGARRMRFKLQFWAKQRIQNVAKYRAHRLGIRFSRVLARGTSKYAFDGSGEVNRSDNRFMATFANKKQYSADLSASYNIAARWFLRELCKPLGATLASLIQAKVPDWESRTCHTLATLKSFWTVLRMESASKPLAA